MTATLTKPPPLSAVRPAPPPECAPPERLVRTPLFTRHMLGAIEAERDRRLLHRRKTPRARAPRPIASLPRLRAALAADAAARRSDARAAGASDPKGTS